MERHRLIGLAGTAAAVCWLAAASAAASCPWPIHLVVIDEATTKALGPLPWPRGAHAKLVNALGRAGAKAIVLAFHFRDPGPGKGDASLSAAMRRHGRVYLSTGKADQAQPWEPDDAWLDRMALNVEGKPPKKLRKFDHINLPVREFADAAAGIGATDRLVGAQKELVGLPLMVRHGKWIIPSMGLRLFLDLSEMSGAALPIRKGKDLVLKGRRLNMDKYGSIMVRITPPGSAYPTHSYIDVLKGEKGSGTFRGAVVLVGIRDDATSIKTATGPKISLELIGDQLSTLCQYVNEQGGEE